MPARIFCTPCECDKCRMVTGWNMQMVCQQFSDLPRWSASTRFNLAKGNAGITDQACQFILGQVQSLASLLEPMAERPCEFHNIQL